MAHPPSDAAPPIAARASACARHVTPSSASLAENPDFGHAFQALLAAVASSDPQYAFDREGRPDALRAVRSALPAMEAELFDAIMEDMACELAAVQEAFRQLTLAIRNRDS